MACIIRSCLTQDIKYHMMNETSAKKIWEIFKSKYLTKSTENWEALSLTVEKKEISIDGHINNYMKFLADLTKLDEVIKDETRC